MSQVSLLLSQYHRLLTHTLNDKERYHKEEREYRDKMHNLRQQMEKLEEKIMEQGPAWQESPRLLQAGYRQKVGNDERRGEEEATSKYPGPVGAA